MDKATAVFSFRDYDRLQQKYAWGRSRDACSPSTSAVYVMQLIFNGRWHRTTFLPTRRGINNRAAPFDGMVGRLSSIYTSMMMKCRPKAICTRATQKLPSREWREPTVYGVSLGWMHTLGVACGSTCRLSTMKFERCSILRFLVYSAFVWHSPFVQVEIIHRQASDQRARRRSKLATKYDNNDVMNITDNNENNNNDDDDERGRFAFHT